MIRGETAKRIPSFAAQPPTSGKGDPGGGKKSKVLQKVGETAKRKQKGDQVVMKKKERERNISCGIYYKVKKPPTEEPLLRGKLRTERGPDGGTLPGKKNSV